MSIIKKTMDGNTAAAYASYPFTEVATIYPITPSSPMAEMIDERFGAVEIQVTPARSGITPHVGMEALIRIPAKVSIKKKIAKLQELDHVVFALQLK